VAFDEGTVFVLGAGFTRALLPDAPLMVDDYGGKELLDSLQGRELRTARWILELELEACDGKINLERMLTRLHGRMPYDFNNEIVEELDFLRAKIERNFRDRLTSAMASGRVHSNELRDFARHCLDNKVNCITFNYDTLLDEALCEYWPRWNPDSGYGFLCRTSRIEIEQDIFETFPSQILLLKLHGSMNWRVPLGQPEPYGPGAFRHHQDWYPRNPSGTVSLEEIGDSLKPRFFFVPPILTKTELVQQPILRLLWSKAHELLFNAKRVVFIGYSMPLTDIATGFLFRESLQFPSPDLITVVTRPSVETESQAERAELLRAYQNVFPKLTERQIVCSGARQWVFDNLTHWLYDSHGNPIAFIYGKHVISRSGRFFGTMIDSELVWGDGQGDQSTYMGQLEQGNRLFFQEDLKAAPKYTMVEAPALPGIPAVVPPQIGPCAFRPGVRDVEIE
jgi:hypothetical protein